VLGVVTGKPLAIGGSLGREEATARGALYVIADALAEQDRSLAGQRIAIQGFGNVGAHLARLVADEGAVVIAVSDSGGGLYAPDGLDVSSVLAHKAEHGTLEGFSAADAISNDELLLLECDVLAPCALEQVVHAGNAAEVKARMIAEGANGPVTPAADEILEDRGVLVLPDVLANAGGVVVSYFEWVQGLQEYFWKEEEVNARLNEIVTRAYQETAETSRRHGMSMRRAAYGLAVGRVAEATVTRGLYP
jgi:glutamate dehydrogenase/leucine dehydrogenase